MLWAHNRRAGFAARSCKKDIKRRCKGVKDGHGEVTACLRCSPIAYLCNCESVAQPLHPCHSNVSSSWLPCRESTHMCRSQPERLTQRCYNEVFLVEQGAADDIRQDPQLWAACKVLLCIGILLVVRANAIRRTAIRCGKPSSASNSNNPSGLTQQIVCSLWNEKWPSVIMFGLQADADKHCKKAKFEKGRMQQCLRRHRMVC